MKEYTKITHKAQIIGKEKKLLQYHGVTDSIMSAAYRNRNTRLVNPQDDVYRVEISQTKGSFS